MLTIPGSRLAAFALVAAAIGLAGTVGAATVPEPGHRLENPGDGATRLGDGWLSTTANDYNLSIDADGTVLVFARSSTADFKDAQIWIARRQGAGWARPARASFSDPRYRDSDPWLTPDGAWLYFISDRPAMPDDAARQDLDLWRAAMRDGVPGEPEHLATVSSPGEELGPELHDGWLYFNSTRPGGPAALALYRAPAVEGGFGAAEPLPPPFNDGRAQGDFTLSPDGRIAMFWSSRGDNADPDLFAVRRRGDVWAAPVRLPPPFNAAGLDFTPAFSADGTTLRWASQRGRDSNGTAAPGGADLYAAPVRLLEDALGE
jgi:hypothetical protein